VSARRWTGIMDEAADGPSIGRVMEWLDEGQDSDGDTYREMRRRLIAYFDRRNRRDPDRLADETFVRVATVLDEESGAIIVAPARYCYGIARSLLLEDLQREILVGSPDQAPAAERDSGSGPGSIATDDLAAIRKRRFECLARCLGKLSPRQRQLAVDYYRDEPQQNVERRLRLANRLGITPAALAVRAGRIRSRLESGVEDCAGAR
jgi:DNA-directed RNA polymerase specialized sigma24 family protein